MQHCAKCKVNIAGDKRCCPLCQGELTGKGNPRTDVFPIIPKEKFAVMFLFRLITFIAIAAMAICIAVNLMLPTGIWWSLYAAAGIFCLWVAGTVGLAKRYNFIKNITYQIFIVSVMALLWDHFTGRLGWSLDYVIPCSCGAAMIFMAVMIFTKRIDAEQYIIYFILDCLYGIVPIVFILTGILNVVYPSAVCVALSVISIAALLLFEGKTMKEELVRKLHM